MTIIEPTVGRKVWYRPSKEQVATDDHIHGMDVIKNQPLDATVIAVWDTRRVNLFVVDARGEAFPVMHVLLVQEGDPIPEQGCYCEWMPYQKGQAAKST